MVEIWFEELQSLPSEWREELKSIHQRYKLYYNCLLPDYLKVANRKENDDEIRDLGTTKHEIEIKGRDKVYQASKELIDAIKAIKVALENLKKEPPFSVKSEDLPKIYLKESGLVVKGSLDLKTILIAKEGNPASEVSVSENNIARLVEELQMNCNVYGN